MWAFIRKGCCAILLLGLFSFVLTAQEKARNYYYNGHGNEILPDARAAFQEGRYARTVELCTWHYVYFGDQAANALSGKAERCAELLKEMTELDAAGKLREAKNVAALLLSLNPKDIPARDILAKVELPPVDSLPAPAPPVQDTVRAEKPDSLARKEEVIVPEEVVAPEPEKEAIPAEVVPEPEKTEEQVEEKPEETLLPSVSKPLNRFVVKGNVAVLDLGQPLKTFSLGGSLGLYDIGGGPLGAEVGAYLCPALFMSSVALLGVDASVVFRATRRLYPKAGLGFFSSRSTSLEGARTKGLCAGLGLSILTGEHLAVEIGLKYYPAVRMQGKEEVTTADAKYTFLSTVDVLSGGLAPMIGIGWCF